MHWIMQQYNAFCVLNPAGTVVAFYAHPLADIIQKAKRLFVDLDHKTDSRQNVLVVVSHVAILSHDVACRNVRMSTSRQGGD